MVTTRASSTHGTADKQPKNGTQIAGSRHETAADIIRETAPHWRFATHSEGKISHL